MNLFGKSSRGLKLGRFCIGHLAEVRAPEMAAALSFRTLFGLIPVFFVATLVTRSLLGDSFPKFIRSMVEMAGMDTVTVSSASTASGEPTRVQLSAWIEEIVAFTGTLNLSAIGIIGVVVVLFSALWLIVTIEESFNVVCRAPNSRPWHRRLLVYWSVLTLGPIFLASLPLLSNELQAMLARSEALSHLFVYAQSVLGFLLLWGFLLFAYSVIPTERMRWKTIVAGALIGAIGLELGRRFLGIYMAKAFTVNRLYGSLGLVPVFMFWIYTMWLIVLFGLQVSSLLNSLLSKERVRSTMSGPTTSFEPAVAVCAMDWLCARYRRGEPSHVAAMADEMHLDLATASRLAHQLAQARMVIFVPDDGILVPARPLESMSVSDALRVGITLASEGREDDPVSIVSTLRAAQLDAVRNITFADRATCQKGQGAAE